MWQFFTAINKKLVLAIPLMLMLGFFAGIQLDNNVLAQLKNLIVPLTFLMVYPMMVTLNIKHLLEGVKNVPLQLMTQLINFGVIPFLAYGLGKYFFLTTAIWPWGCCWPRCCPPAA